MAARALFEVLGHFVESISLRRIDDHDVRLPVVVYVGPDDEVGLTGDVLIDVLVSGAWSTTDSPRAPFCGFILVERALRNVSDWCGCAPRIPMYMNPIHLVAGWRFAQAIFGPADRGRSIGRARSCK
ncbi:hypothetical protein FTX61_01030 [Nitriliruptoraceae bacterium ZYF776]|nr:hypothetical protein [Profundirhabdus halotolerans]